jgi:hypothetical protein
MAEKVLIQKVDLPAVVGQFLINVRPEDLIVELVQNELAAGSTATSIQFGRDRLICEGNGDPIDEGGWARLEVMLGAGNEVRAKPSGFGAKNHGLRTGFWLGDDIMVQSAGERLVLTLCGDPDRPGTYHPGTWPKESDGRAPARGTRVTIPYRRADLVVSSAEGVTLPSWDHARLGALFERAVDEAPGRFIGALRPGTRASYFLDFAHWDGRRCRLEFHCAPLRGAELNRRSCRAVDASGRRRVLVQEIGATFPLLLPEDDTCDVRRFFRRRDKILGEVAWQIDRRGRPVPTTGKLRYAISYPDGEHAAFSDHGFHIAGPFLSDTARHGVAEAPRNASIVEQARTAFASVLRRHLLPAHGPDALALMRRPDRPDRIAEDTLAARVIDAGAVAVRTLSRFSATRSGRRRGRRANRQELAAQSGPNWRVSIAAFSWSPDMSNRASSRSRRRAISCCTRRRHLL